MKLAFQLVTGLVLSAGVVAVLSAWSNEEPNEISPAEIAASDARRICKDAIESGLRDPSSADWGVTSENFYGAWPAQVTDESVTVAPQFRAANGFGGVTLSQWTCVVEITQGGYAIAQLAEI